MDITCELGQQFGLLLTPAHNLLLSNYLSHRGGDYFRWYVDWDMHDVIHDALVRAGDVWYAEQLHRAALDRLITKQFRNIARMSDNLLAFQGEQAPNATWNRNFIVASDFVWELMSIGERSLLPKLIDQGTDLREIISNMQASAGVTAPGCVKGDVLPQILDSALKIKAEIAKGTPFSEIWLPAIEFHRAQISNFINDEGEVDSSEIKYKDRSVMGEDGGSIAVQGQYATVLMAALCANFNQYAGGKSSAVLRNFIDYYCRGKYWVSTDMSKFDQHLPSWLISAAFHLIKRCFPVECQRELDWIEYDFIHKKVIGYDGRLWSKEKGIPSGNNFTQIVGSICNLLMILTFLASRKQGDVRAKREFLAEELRPEHNGRRQYATVLAMGDDNIIFTMHPFPIEAYATYAKKVFGMTVNAEKSSSGLNKAPEFLKRSWTKWGEWREPLEFFIQLIHPENPRHYEEEGYSVYHILYGLYQTYQAMMSKYWTEEELIRGMVKSGVGMEPLLTLGRSSRQHVPGSLRVMSDVERRILYDRATRIATRLTA